MNLEKEAASNPGTRDIQKSHWAENHIMEKKLAGFKTRLNHTFPDFYPYLVRRLNMAELTGALEKSNYNANSVLDSVYQGLCRRFENEPQKLEQLKVWVYQIGEMILEETLQEKIFEETHSMDLEKIKKKELSELEEVYTIDAEAELVLVEDLNHEVYPQQYDPMAILEDDSTMEEIERALALEDRRILHQEIRKILIQLPENERTVFDLFWLGEFEIDQIAEVRNLPVTEVETTLKKVTLQVKESLGELLNRGDI